MQGMQKEKVALRAACAVIKSSCAKSLHKVSTLRVEKATQEQRTEVMMRRLAEDLSARERSLAKKRHTKNAVIVKEKLTEQVKQLLARVT